MRIFVSDYSGHPFQVQLSRALAARGHDVLHVSSKSFQTPKGKLGVTAADPATFKSVEVRTKEPFAKSSFVKRRQQEIEVGRLIGAQIRDFRPDIVISSNAPLDTQRYIQRAARAAGAGFVFWVQDLYAEAMLRILPGKFGLLGEVIGRFYRRIERRMIEKSDHAVVIAPEFRDVLLAQMNLPADRVSVIENWAPLEDLPPAPRDNDWARANLAPTALRIIYSGTLGFKHNPGLLLKLARQVEDDLLVFSEGPAAESLADEAAREGVSNLQVRGWLPFEDLPSALAAADMLVVILEPDAGAFSVPSKALTYLCAGRPILGSIAGSNLAARLIRESGAGLAADPEDEEGFLAAAETLAADSELRARMGRKGRAYAEQNFNIDRITDRFETILDSIGPKRG